MYNILVVDNDTGMQHIIERILLPLGFNIFSAKDGSSALEECIKVKPDLVIMDITLPDMDGYDIISEIRKINPISIFLILTSISELDTAVELVKKGAYDYISKPFMIDEFVRLVKKTLHVEEKIIEKKPKEQKKEVIILQQAKIIQKKKNLKIPFAIATVLIAAATVLIGKMHYVNSLNENFAILSSNPSVILPQGKYIWVTDWATETIYKYERNKELQIVEKYKLQDIQPTGMSFDGKIAWVSNSFEGKIYKLNIDLNTQVLASYNSPGPSPAGLFIDGENLWSIDFQQSKIYKHIMDDKLTIIDAYDSPAKKPCAIFGYKTDLFIADSQTNRIYKVSKDEFMLKAVYNLPDLEEMKTHLSSIAFDGKSIWVCLDESQKVFRYNFNKLKPIKV